MMKVLNTYIEHDPINDQVTIIFQCESMPGKASEKFYKLEGIYGHIYLEPIHSDKAQELINAQSGG